MQCLLKPTLRTAQSHFYPHSIGQSKSRDQKLILWTEDNMLSTGLSFSCYNKIPYNRRLFPQPWMLGIKVLAHSVLGEDSSWSAHGHLLVSSQEKTEAADSVGGGLSCIFLTKALISSWGLLSNDLITSSGLISKYHHIGDWGFNMWIWGDTIQSTASIRQLVFAEQ